VTDVRLDGDEMPADADDGDAGHSSGTYMARELPRASSPNVARTIPTGLSFEEVPYGRVPAVRTEVAS
jgi:hypothetical protein